MNNEIKKIIDRIKDKDVRNTTKDEFGSWSKYFEDLNIPEDTATKKILKKCKDKETYGRVFFKFDENNQKPDVSKTRFPENFNHRFAGFIDLIPGSAKDVWIGWDFREKNQVVIKEVPANAPKELKKRIDWEMGILKNLPNNKEIKGFPKIVESSKKGNKTSWFATAFNNCGDLEGILFPPRRRSENNIQDDIEEDLTNENRQALKKDLKFFATEINKNNWNKSRVFFLKLIETVELLHKEGIAHLDIQPSNIHINYLNNDYELILSDFDRAYNGNKDKEEDSLAIQKILALDEDKKDVPPGRSVCDAPERFKKVDEHFKFEDAKKADIYSLGATIAGILLRKPEVFKEYADKNFKGNQPEKVKEERAKFTEQITNAPELPRKVKWLLKKEMNENPDERHKDVQEFRKEFEEIQDWVSDFEATQKEKEEQRKRIEEEREKNKEAIRKARSTKTKWIVIPIVFTILIAIGLLFLITSGKWKHVRYNVIKLNQTTKLKKTSWYRKPYLLMENIFVEEGDTLEIEPGAIIYTDENSSLTIAQGGFIIAEGTRDNPIVFTPRLKNHESKDLIGFWGGITICGKAPIAEDSSKTSSLEFFNEEKDSSNITFGGSKSTHNSGIFQYVRIEYAGNIVQKEDKAFNGLSLAGVGSGTKIDHVWVYKSGDDAFEFYGGSVHAHHLVSEGTIDDDLDIEDDYKFTGKVEPALIINTTVEEKKFFSSDYIDNSIDNFITNNKKENLISRDSLLKFIDSIKTVTEGKFAIEGMENLVALGDTSYISQVTIYFPHTLYDPEMFSQQSEDKILTNTLIFLDNHKYYNRKGDFLMQSNDFIKAEESNYKLKINSRRDTSNWIGAFTYPSDTSGYKWDEGKWKIPYSSHTNWFYLIKVITLFIIGLFTILLLIVRAFREKVVEKIIKLFKVQ